MAVFSTRKRKDAEASASLEDIFNAGAAEAGKKSKWKAFSESKPVQALTSGAKAFAKWTAAKTVSAAKWTGTKIKDAAHDTAQGARSFGKSFAESYHDRQETKRTNKYIKGCEERGFVVMSKEEFSKSFQSMQELQHVLYNTPESGVSADSMGFSISAEDLDTTVIAMSKSLQRYTDTNGVPVVNKDEKSEPTAPADVASVDVLPIDAVKDKNPLVRPTVTYFTTSEKDPVKPDVSKSDNGFKPAGDLSSSASNDKSAEAGGAFHAPGPLSAVSVKNDVKDAANNGTKSAKFSQQLAFMHEAFLTHCESIKETLTKMSEAKTEKEKTQIANDCMKSLTSSLYDMGKTASTQRTQINNFKRKNNSGANRGKDLNILVEPEDASKSVDMEAGV